MRGPRKTKEGLQQPLVTKNFIPEPAIDPATGQLYVVWLDSRFNGGNHDEIALSTSTDGGNTWSTPIRVNTPTGRPAFNPSVRVNSAGTVAVTYYDLRNLAAGNTTTLPTDVWKTTSTNLGASFGNEVHLAGSFDMLLAPFAEGFFVGDYEGLDARGTSFLPFFVVTDTTSDPADVVTVPLPSLTVSLNMRIEYNRRNANPERKR